MNPIKVTLLTLFALTAGMTTLSSCTKASLSSDDKFEKYWSDLENKNPIQHDQQWIDEWLARSKSLSRKQIKAMSAKKFIDVLKKHTLVFIGANEDWYEFGVHTEIKEWPNKKEIPYLLSQVDNNEICADTDYPMFSVVKTEYSTVGQKSLELLQAVKDGEYKYGINIKNKESLIAWAKEEAKKLEAVK